MVHQFSTVIFLGPGNDLCPLITKKLPKFSLPVLNESLLDLNIKWIDPISDKIFIVVLEELKDLVKNIVENPKIEIITYQDYEGTYTVLREISSKLKDDVAIFKGDLIAKIDAVQISEKYWVSKNFLTVFAKKKKGIDLVGFKDNKLMYYHHDTTTFKGISNKMILNNNKISFSTKNEMLQLYFLNKKHLNYDYDEFSFQTDILPLIVSRLKDTQPIEMAIFDENEILQIRSLKTYMDANFSFKNEREFDVYTENSSELCSEYINKNRVSFKGHKNESNTVTGTNLVVGENSKITNSVIGKNVTIGINTKIKNSIIMDSVKIGSNCFFENCIVGHKAVVCDQVNITNCQISYGYQFEGPIKAKKRGFIKFDPEDDKNVEVIGFTTKYLFEDRDQENAKIQDCKKSENEENADNKNVLDICKSKNIGLVDFIEPVDLSSNDSQQKCDK
ncbi:hypothetical protein EDEG_01923 [Edhazardia aedis USNM 41457]|uniref:Translation initiation factor eIF2B subunit gamma n=1 Tax=Edhazardia aedis (strain USNM 41457) TaxID=1003232 RepID=J9D8E8_EDHAE|nr:hypothetical protein EDEG_01923 [Edhazardia aedis USNM 41457]|eukprot:EJW03794.1 hypothetical protein EDEG_01923 [Edhazardia aedis USNM 41457]